MSVPKLSLKKPWTSWDKNAMIEGFQQNKNIDDMCALLGRTSDSVFRYRNQLALKELVDGVVVDDVKTKYNYTSDEISELTKKRDKKDQKNQSDKKRNDEIRFIYPYVIEKYKDSGLSNDQLYAMQLFDKGENLFLTGPGGTGKTYLIEQMVKSAQKQGKSIAVTALTGCAAILLPGGKTIHSQAKVGAKIGNSEWPKERIVSDIMDKVDNGRKTADCDFEKKYGSKSFTAKRKAAESISLFHSYTTDILIVDEVSMMSDEFFDVIDQVFKAGVSIAKQNTSCRTQPFGGMQIVFVGDFYQLPPVSRDKVVGYCFQHPLWSTLFPTKQIVQLTTQHRQVDEQFSGALNNIRNGTITKENIEMFRNMTEPHRNYNKDENGGLEALKLFPHNESVNIENQKRFSEIEGDIMVFEMNTKKDLERNINYHTGEEDGSYISPNEVRRCKEAIKEAIRYHCYDKKNKPIPGRTVEGWYHNQYEKMMKDIPAVSTLELKVGAQVMATANLDIENGIVNGSMGEVVGYDSTTGRFNIVKPRVRFYNKLTGNHHEIVVPMRWWQDPGDFKTLAIGQFPLRLAYAITIHKSQGASLDMVQIDAGSRVFGDGMTYVALSRMRTPNGLYLMRFDPSKIKANRDVIQYYRSIPNVTYIMVCDDTDTDTPDKIF